MKKIRLILLSVTVMAWPIAYAMEKNVNHDDLTDYDKLLIDTSQSQQEVENMTMEIPSAYIHKTIQQQISEYRKAYTQAFNTEMQRNIGDFEHSEGKDSFVENFTRLHIPGLFDIAKSGFALVYNITIKEGSETTKAAILENLRMLYHQAAQLDNNHEMTQGAFVVIHLLLAAMADIVKGVDNSKLGTIPEISQLIQNFSQNIPKVLEIERIKNGWSSDSLLFFPPIIIYANPDYVSQGKVKTSIAPGTFVDQEFAKPFGCGLIMFDVMSRPYSGVEGKLGTKKDPHYSIFNGTLKFLTHDLSHIREKYEVMDELEKVGLHKKIREILQNINQLRKFYQSHITNINTDNKTKIYSRNIYKILTNGLFILTHEIFNVIFDSRSLLSLADFSSNLAKTQQGNEKSLLKNFLAEIKENMSKAALDLPRDFILQLGLRQPGGYKIDYRDHEFILKNTVDLTGEPFFKIDFEETLTKEERGEKKQEVIAKGYQRFWDTFLAIVQKGENIEFSS